jgi:hypothetical protein
MENSIKKNLYDTWGFDQNNNQKLLREINYDNQVENKKHNFDIQNELHKKIRNENDYDDWEYGTEPIPLDHWKR